MITVHPVYFDTRNANNFEANLEIKGGPMFDTTVDPNGGGDVSVQSNWVEALWRWDVEFVRQSYAFGYLTGFFLGRRGRGYGFFMIDPLDYNSTDQNGTGIVYLDGSGNYRLGKTYPDQSPFQTWSTAVHYVRPVCPIETPTLAGVTGSSLVADPTTGIIPTATSTGTWSGQFSTAAMFGTDLFDPESNPKTGEWSSVKIEQIPNYVTAS